MKKSYLVQAWLVIVLALCFGAALAGVQSALHGRIEQNKLNDTLGQIPNLVPGAVRGEATKVGEQKVYRALNADGELVGWVVFARGQGFADVIELLVGLDKDARRITGLYVLKQLETPGLGDNITKADWRNQFAGKPADRALVLTKRARAAENEIQGITGATISSSSVVGIVNSAVARFRAALREANP